MVSGCGDSAAGRTESLDPLIIPLLCDIRHLVTRHPSGCLSPAYRGRKVHAEAHKYTANTSIWFADIGASALSVPRAPRMRVACVISTGSSFFFLSSFHHPCAPHHPCMAWSAFFFSNFFLGRSWMTMDVAGRMQWFWADRPLDSLTNRVASYRFLPLCLCLCASRSR